VPTARAEATIAAPIEVVWDVMLDAGAYPRWNPFIVRFDLLGGGHPSVGDRVRLHVEWHTGGRARATERITALEPPAGGTALLEYAYGGPVAALGMVRGRRQQRLTALDAGTTLYDTDETLTGWASRLAPIAKVQDGFERHAEALKERSEALVP
jgi:uncharacterized protein YndB with AHSA1/START domain